MIATAYNNQPNTTDTHGHAQRSMSIRRAVICVEGGCVLEGESTSYGSTPLSFVLLVVVAVVRFVVVVNCELRVPRKIMWTAGDVMPVACKNFGLSSHGLSMDIRCGTHGQEPKKILIKKSCSRNSGYFRRKQELPEKKTEIRNSWQDFLL